MDKAMCWAMLESISMAMDGNRKCVCVRARARVMCVETLCIQHLKSVMFIVIIMIKACAIQLQIFWFNLLLAKKQICLSIFYTLLALIQILSQN